MKNILKSLKLEAIYLLDMPENQRCENIAHYDIKGGYDRIYFYHIRKASGTSLNYLFLSLGGKDGEKVFKDMYNTRSLRAISGGKVFVGWNKRLIEQGHYYYAFSHMPQHMFTLPDKTFTITCLRNPARRLLSHYKMLLYFRTNKVPHICMRTEGKWLGDSFADFLQNIPREELLNQLYMFSRAFDVDEAFENIMGCSHFFFTEEFSSGLSSLSSKLGIALQPITASKGRMNSEITEQDRRILESRLEPEYILLDKLKKYKATETL
jgi:hypothetical protein